MNPMIFLFLLLVMMGRPAFCDEGVSDPGVSSDFSQWENEFKSSLEDISPAPAETKPAPAVKALPALKAADVAAAKDLPGSGDGSRVDRLENAVAQLERTVKALEDRQRSIDRSVDDLKRRR